MTLTGTAAAALDNREINHALFGFLDILGDPVRATTWFTSVTFSGTGDADLDGQTYSAVSHELIDISEVKIGDSGADTMTVALSGLAGIDTDLLNNLADRSKYAGRRARFWHAVYDAASPSASRIGALGHWFSGYMTGVKIEGDPEEQRIVVSIENYRAAMSAPSNRSYMSQAQYDAGDLSARATLSAAAGVTANPAMAGVMAGPDGASKGGDPRTRLARY